MPSARMPLAELGSFEAVLPGTGASRSPSKTGGGTLAAGAVRVEFGNDLLRQVAEGSAVFRVRRGGADR